MDSELEDSAPQRLNCLCSGQLILRLSASLSPKIDVECTFQNAAAVSLDIIQRSFPASPTRSSARASTVFSRKASRLQRHKTLASHARSVNRPHALSKQILTKDINLALCTDKGLRGASFTRYTKATQSRANTVTTRTDPAHRNLNGIAPTSTPHVAPKISTFKIVRNLVSFLKGYLSFSHQTTFPDKIARSL